MRDLILESAVLQWIPVPIVLFVYFMMDNTTYMPLEAARITSMHQEIYSNKTYCHRRAATIFALLCWKRRKRNTLSLPIRLLQMKVFRGHITGIEMGPVVKVCCMSLNTFRKAANKQRQVGSSASSFSKFQRGWFRVLKVQSTYRRTMEHRTQETGEERHARQYG